MVISSYIEDITRRLEDMGPVVRKPISTNRWLKETQGFWFSCLKPLPLLTLRDNLKAAKVKLLTEKKLLWIHVVVD